MTHAETTTSRAARIAAIHMLADWLAEHPEVPMPTSVMATWLLDLSDEVDQATRYAAVHALAEQLGERDYGTDYGDHSPQFDHVLATHQTHGVEITYRGSTFSNAYYGRQL